MDHMGLWGFLTICGVVAIICGVFEERIKSRAKVMLGQQSQESDKKLEELIARMERLEQRMANIETITLDHEKGKPFERL